MTKPLADPFTHVIGDRLNSQEVSVCNVCGLGVFKHQQWVFARRPLGICHVDCLDVDGGAR